MKVGPALIVLAVFMLGACATKRGTEASLERLDIPAGEGPFPAVVLLHGCNGVGPNIAVWQTVLHEHGYASVVIDSFGPRWINEICTDSSRWPMHRRVEDVYIGLAKLVENPQIDARRVALMGFSNGGVAVLSALTRTVLLRLPPDRPHYSAGVALYPDCSIFPDARFSVPISTLIGNVDDWTPSHYCKKLAAATRVRPGSPPFEVKVYEGAHHAFDYPGLQFLYRAEVRNMHSRSGYGASVAGNLAVTRQAQVDVIEFLDRVMTKHSPYGVPPKNMGLPPK